MIHLIFENLTFNEEFKNYFERENFHPANQKEYQTLAIIGCQSSGKSTLLNYIFGTDFEVMSEEKGRGQTTQGIWASINREFSTIVFDVEGTDAKERGDDRFKFEQCSSLFALAMADVLMINMWTSDIGRYTASNYGVLKIVFEMNLKLFQQESEKKIVIVLRDFSSQTDDAQTLFNCIIGDIKQIWTEIKKPEQFQNSSAEKFFKFEFFTLPHKFYFEEDFKKGIEDIKNKLRVPTNDSEREKYLFNHVKYEKNVPIDGMYKYTSDMWSNIINNKDLNIPGQKEMLAQFRCNEIKDQALSSVDGDINSLEIESSTKMMGDFKEKAQLIVDKANQSYDKSAKDYLPYVYQDVKKQLNTALASKMYSCFGNQLKRLIPKYQKEFRIELEKKVGEDADFFKVATEIKKKFLEKLDEDCKKIKVFDEWELGDNNEGLFEEIIEHQRQIALENKKEEIEKQIRNLVQDSLDSKFDNIDKDFWSEINQDIAHHFYSIFAAFNKCLIDFYKMEKEELKPFITETEKSIVNSIKKDFSKKVKSLNEIAVDNFKKQFWYSDGVPRQWNKLPQSFIDEIYSKMKPENLYVFDLFKTFKVLPNPLQVVDYSFNDEEEEEISKKISEKIPQLLESPDNKFEELIKEEEIKSMKMSYSEKVGELYDDACRRHLNIKQSSIPLWAWILIIYLGYDDVWKMITGYWLIPAVIILALYGVLHFLGLGNLPFMIYNMIKSQLGNSSKK